VGIGLLFWIIYVVCVIFGLYAGKAIPPDGRWNWYGSNLIVWVLLFLLGWHCFGFVIRGE